MIDCPICHVMNEDTARFCAECGQRLTAIKNAPAGSPEQPSTKLRSPLLSSGDEPAQPPASDFSRLANIANQSTSPGKAPTSKGLRSPLLGDTQTKSDEQIDIKKDLSSSKDVSSTSGSGLRSPLLGRYDFEEEKSSKQMPQAFSSSPSPTTPPTAAHGGHTLRSPLLGSTDEQQNLDYMEPTFIDDPNVLRSPLLEAKLPLSEQTAGAHSSTSSAPPVSNPIINRPSAEAPIDRTQSSTKPVLPAFEPTYISPASPSSRPAGIKASPIESRTSETKSSPQEFSGTNQQRMHSKLFEEETIESPLTRLKHQAESNAVAPQSSLFLIVLVPAAIFKVWLIIQNLNQLILVADQFSQLVILAYLIYLSITLSRAK